MLLVQKKLPNAELIYSKYVEDSIVETMKEIKCASCWYFSHIHCTMHGYSNVKSAKLTFPEITGYQMKYNTV